MGAGTPLWPAGHLPLKGGDRMLFLLSQISKAVEGTLSVKLPISPLEGEMAGRPEGGERRH
ncbi:MAG: lytic murein transglycosylase, partial [Mesorhizobium sp.]